MTRAGISPALSRLDELVTDCALQDITAGHCLAEIRARGLTPDRIALADAVQALRDRDGLVGGQVDPAAYLDASPGQYGDTFQAAIDRAEADYAWALHIIARPMPQAVAS